MVNHSAGNLSSFLDRPIFFFSFLSLRKGTRKKKWGLFFFCWIFGSFYACRFFLYQKKTCSLIFPHYKHLKHYRGGDPIWLVDLNEVLPKKSWPTPRHIWDKGRLGGGQSKKDFTDVPKMTIFFFSPHSFIQTSASFFFVWFTDFDPPPLPQMFQPSLVGARGRLLCI